jgi:hypothetical protein
MIGSAKWKKWVGPKEKNDVDCALAINQFWFFKTLINWENQCNGKVAIKKWKNYC